MHICKIIFRTEVLFFYWLRLALVSDIIETMNIEFLDEFDPELRQLLTKNTALWQKEVESLLPDNPKPALVKFDNDYLIEGHGTGGFADTGDVLVLAFDIDYADRNEQLSKLRASYLHESYHLGQGWVGDILLDPIAEAILEGAATVFERDKAGTNPEWSQYYEREEMVTLLEQVLELDSDYDHQKWKYLDPVSGKSHLLYRLGTFITDEALRKNPGTTIEMLADKSADEILALSNLHT